MSLPHNEEKDKSKNDMYIPTCQLSVAPRGARGWRETPERRKVRGSRKDQGPRETKSWALGSWSLKAPKPGHKVVK